MTPPTPDPDGWATGWRDHLRQTERADWAHWLAGQIARAEA